VTLRDSSAAPEVVLRPLSVDDADDWHILRDANAAFLRPWEPTLPPGSPVPPPVPFRRFVHDLDAEGRADRALPWALEVDGALAGQVHVFGIVRGGQQSAAVGYWVAQRFTRRGVASRAVALAVDHCLGPVGLHRVELNIRVDNDASLGVARRLGLRDEGVRRLFLHIDGEWRDHRSFAVTVEDLDGGTLRERVSHP
jgi:ribosomal-protein-alanine N-acetyltransferase